MERVANVIGPRSPVTDASSSRQISWSCNGKKSGKYNKNNNNNDNNNNNNQGSFLRVFKAT